MTTAPRLRYGGGVTLGVLFFAVALGTIRASDPPPPAPSQSKKASCVLHEFGDITPQCIGKECAIQSALDGLGCEVQIIGVTRIGVVATLR